MMILYHGSYTAIQTPNIIHSRSRLDFGAGFYLTNIYEQAKKWAVRFRYRKCPCIVNVFELDYDSDVYQMLSTGEADLHCRSDYYVLDELFIEMEYSKQIKEGVVDRMLAYEKAFSIVNSKYTKEED